MSQPALPLYGHDAAQSEFLSARASGRLHHAWIIEGPSGIGKSVTLRHAVGLLHADDGQVLPASTNGAAYPACAPAVLSSGTSEQTSARVDWVLPSEDGRYSITIYALADDTTWYASTYSYRVGESDDADDDGAARVSAFIASVLSGVAAMALW